MMQDNQTRALLEIAKSLVLIATELAELREALREALPGKEVWHELCLSVRSSSDQPLQGETFGAVADALNNIATAMESHVDHIIHSRDPPGA